MQPRSKRLVVSLTRDEKATLRRIAEHEGRLSLTATIRHILNEAARQRGLATSDRSRSLLPATQPMTGEPGGVQVQEVSDDERG